MAEYIYALTGAVLVSELFMLLMPEGKLKIFARTAAGMLMMLMMLVPLKGCPHAEVFPIGQKSEQSANKASYSDIIMDIYTEALEEREAAADG